ncbi:hypothetical protein BB561_005296 [Smittium simulii]|uniref:Protein kinase domain-containing protein n=1 Tax=Smittium simulii TaxID=133385 RepID=A0A2T9YB08_9FUNG|nr:hypothetical protein BB561_005296 [Smittium simulii]
MNTSHSKKNDKPKGIMLGHSIDNGSLYFESLMGVGTYGEVYRTIDYIQKKEYAVKVLPRKNGRHLKPFHEEPFIDARELSPEIKIYAKIPPHPNIIKLERILHTHNQLFIVMESCVGGDLYENISGNPYFNLSGNDALIKRLFIQLINAVSHCHMHGVYHRDLKPENILVTEDGLNVKLIDFGLSTENKVSNEIGCGSAYYMSPESQGGLDGKTTHYETGPNDVWALGIILINLATGRNPWNRANLSDPLFCRYLRNKSFLCQAINATPSFSYIICRTLEINPKLRCTLQELKNMIINCKYFTFSKSYSLSSSETISEQYVKQELHKMPVEAQLMQLNSLSSGKTCNSSAGFHIEKQHFYNKDAKYFNQNQHDNKINDYKLAYCSEKYPKAPSDINHINLYTSNNNRHMMS